MTSNVDMPIPVPDVAGADAGCEGHPPTAPI